MGNLGRKPELRAKIDAALEAYEKEELTDDDALTLTDWSVVQHATSSQACRFERAYEGRYSSGIARVQNAVAGPPWQKNECAAARYPLPLVFIAGMAAGREHQAQARDFRTPSHRGPPYDKA